MNPIKQLIVLRNYKKSLFLNPNRPLHPTVVARGADELLYRIGLSYFRCSPEVKRSLAYHPLVVFLFFFAFLTRNTLFMVFGARLSQSLRYCLADWDYLFGIRGVGNMAILFTSLINMSALLLNGHHANNGRRAPEMVLFEMFAGKESPSSIGFTNMNMVVNYLMAFKLAVKQVHDATRSLWLFGTAAMIMLAIQNSHQGLLVLIYIPMSLPWIIWFNHSHLHLLYHLIYFIFLALYIEQRIKSLIKQLLTKNNTEMCKSTIQSINRLINEIQVFYCNLITCSLMATEIPKQDYSQRIEEGNIGRQKLSRLKLYRLRLHRHRPGWAKGHGLRLYSLSLYGSETGGGGGLAKLYTHLLRFVKKFFPHMLFTPDLTSTLYQKSLFQYNT